MNIRPATKADAEAWLAMRMALWPDAEPDALRGDDLSADLRHNRRGDRIEPAVGRRRLILEQQYAKHA